MNANGHEELMFGPERAVVCTAQNQIQVESIVAYLRGVGFSKNDISVLFPNKDLARGLGAFTIPGLGAFIAAGPIVAALCSAAAGATVAGLTDALLSLGIPQNIAAHYEVKVRAGNSLISVLAYTKSQERRAEAIFKTAHGEDICSTSEGTAPWSRAPTSGEAA